MRLKDKVAIITGGSQGIGREYALRFAREGARIVVADIREAQAQEGVQEIAKLGSEGLALKIDVSKEEDTRRLAAATHERFGRIDILLNNAAIFYDMALEDHSLEYFNKILSVNLNELKGQSAPELLAELVHDLSDLLVSRRIEVAGLIGEGRSRHRQAEGQGIEFSEVRPYQIGDDIRSIDWNVSARTGETYVKIFEEEREQEARKRRKDHLQLPGAPHGETRECTTARADAHHRQDLCRQQRQRRQAVLPYVLSRSGKLRKRGP